MYGTEAGRSRLLNVWYSIWLKKDETREIERAAGIQVRTKQNTWIDENEKEKEMEMVMEMESNANGKKKRERRQVYSVVPCTSLSSP